MVKPIYESGYPLLNVIETKSLVMKHIVLMKNEEHKETTQIKCHKGNKGNEV